MSWKEREEKVEDDNLRFVRFLELRSHMDDRSFENVSEEKEDVINHPKHYTFGNIETIDYIASLGIDEEYAIANCIKYISRYKHKGKPKEDLQKAKWYLEYVLKKHYSEEQDEWQKEG